MRNHPKLVLAAFFLIAGFVLTLASGLPDERSAPIHLQIESDVAPVVAPAIDNDFIQLAKNQSEPWRNPNYIFARPTITPFLAVAPAPQRCLEEKLRSWRTEVEI